MARLHLVLNGMLPVVMMLVFVDACGGYGVAGRNDLVSRRKPTQAEVLVLARSYTFVDPTVPVTAAEDIPNAGVPDADAPTAITIARAVPSVAPAPWPAKLLALVHSDKRYPPLGIEAGDNYIWRDETGSDSRKWETYIVPAAAGANVRLLKRSNVEYSSGDHTQPRLVIQQKRAGITALAACLEDPACSTTGHCGYGN